MKRKSFETLPYRLVPLAAWRAVDSLRDGVMRVLAYHRLRGPSEDFRGDPHLLSATCAMFDQQMDYISSHYFPITAHQAVAALRGDTRLPSRAILVTFDDGYRDFRAYAWPILKDYGVPALLFVSTAFPSASRGFWWDELHEMVAQTEARRVDVSDLGSFPLETGEDRWNAVRALNRFLKRLAPYDLSAKLQELRSALGTPKFGESLVLTWDELRSLTADGLAVGSHTRTHSAMPYLTTQQLVDEMHGAHADLERELGQFLPLFSYPFGFADARVVPILRELGYVGAFISLLGRNIHGQMDPFLLFRHSVDVDESFSRFAVSLTSQYGLVRESGRAIRARLQHNLPRLIRSR